MSESQESSTEEKNRQIQIDIDDDIAQGVYTNLAISNFSREEFVVDFAFLQPQGTKGKIRSRVILSPNNAKRLAEMLQANIREYEEKVGSISDEKPEKGFNISFN
ncbi:MAG: hypothetical protein ACI9BD_000134 [Candidatus Marinamargulisbacteria bacterium]|jgi:hypothetical protein